MSANRRRRTSRVSNTLVSEEEKAQEAPRYIFSYGTLRADFRKNRDGSSGDDWGVVDETCQWFYASAAGFSLYQDKGQSYPFAVQNSDSNDGVVVGTVLTWDSTKLFNYKLQQCNDIEGQKNSLKYKRSIVKVTSLDGKKTVDAYIYHRAAGKQERAEAIAYPQGDWLKDWEKVDPWVNKIVDRLTCDQADDADVDLEFSTSAGTTSVETSVEPHSSDDENEVPTDDEYEAFADADADLSSDDEDEDETSKKNQSQPLCKYLSANQRKLMHSHRHRYISAYYTY